MTRRVPSSSPAERALQGKALRKQLARSAHALVAPAERDPVALLEQSNRGRVPALVPLRYGRMLANPFAFFRGAAVLMAHDLAQGPRSAIEWQLCGDCHLMNFGAVVGTSGEGRFGINDFDETSAGPFEWDIKRLAASVVVAFRARGFVERAARDAVLGLVAAYRNALAAACWADGRTSANRNNKLRIRDEIRRANGRWRIKDDPPRLTHFPEKPARERVRFEADLRGLLRRYRTSLAPAGHALLDGRELHDAVVRVGGVGSLGMRGAVALLAHDRARPLLLQLKQARASCLAPYVRPSLFSNDGERVASGQRLLQAVPDVLLGWARSTTYRADFVVREWRNPKSGSDLELMPASDLAERAKACGVALAQAQSHAGDACVIAGYLGKRDVFDRAIEAFAIACADRNEADWKALKAAVASGRVHAITGL